MVYMLIYLVLLTLNYQGMMFKVIHLELTESNAFVKNHHRHIDETQGHRFSIGCQHENKLVGVAIAGRPISRHYDQSKIIEVTRLCTDGTENACSFLYSMCAKASKYLGYERIQSYVLESELGSSLKASNFIYSHTSEVSNWNKYKRNKKDRIKLLQYNAKHGIPLAQKKKLFYRDLI